MTPTSSHVEQAERQVTGPERGQHQEMRHVHPGEVHVEEIPVGRGALEDPPGDVVHDRGVVDERPAAGGPEQPEPGERHQEDGHGRRDPKAGGPAVARGHRRRGRRAHAAASPRTSARAASRHLGPADARPWAGTHGCERVERVATTTLLKLLLAPVAHPPRDACRTPLGASRRRMAGRAPADLRPRLPHPRSRARPGLRGPRGVGHALRARLAGGVLLRLWRGGPMGGMERLPRRGARRLRGVDACAPGRDAPARPRVRPRVCRARRRRCGHVGRVRRPGPRRASWPVTWQSAWRSPPRWCCC